MHWPFLKAESLASALGWPSPTEAQLEATEARLFAGVKSLSQGRPVDIGPVISPDGDYIMTRWANIESPRTPLLLLHGFGMGSAIWCTNVDALAKDRPVYTIDILGFGRSSRPTFSTDQNEIEAQFVASLEAWRKAIGLEKFYIGGHSFGGYISSLYAMEYPTRVEHLLLIDPWGFPARPPGWQLPLWAKPVEVGAACILPFFALRAAGPLGYLYLRMFPPFFTDNITNVPDACRSVTDYFYHINVVKPSGERAFHALMLGIAWAKRPLVERFRVSPELPVTFLYGETSWVWHDPGEAIKKSRPKSYVDVKVIPNAGHEIYSDQPRVFNRIVRRLLSGVDSGAVPRNSAALPVTRRPSWQLRYLAQAKTASKGLSLDWYQDDAKLNHREDDLAACLPASPLLDTPLDTSDVGAEMSDVCGDEALTSDVFYESQASALTVNSLFGEEMPADCSEDSDSETESSVSHGSGGRNVNINTGALQRLTSPLEELSSRFIRRLLR